MATYNAGAYLHAQISSLLGQTYSDIEIVIADDGSDDSTFELLKQYAAQDSRIRLLPQSQHLGFNMNFMRCFRACRGQLISPCDQDDIWSPDKTGKLVAACCGNGLASCDSRFIDAHGLPPRSGPTRMSATRRMGDDPPLLGLLHGNAISGHALMFPASLLERLPNVPEASFFDWWIVVIARAKGMPLRHVAEPLVAYRRHAGAVTARNAGTQRTSSKQQLLQARYATVHALAHSTFADGQEYLNAFEAWLQGRFPLTAAAYFWRQRKAIFWSTSLRRWPAIHAIRYVFGYRLRQTLRPRRHPILLGITHGKLEFHQEE
ncbi:MAG: glycosyltransferase [Lysobacter sp.]